MGKSQGGVGEVKRGCWLSCSGGLSARSVSRLCEFSLFYLSGYDIHDPFWKAILARDDAFRCGSCKLPCMHPFLWVNHHAFMIIVFNGYRTKECHHLVCLRCLHMQIQYRDIPTHIWISKEPPYTAQELETLFAESVIHVLLYHCPVCHAEKITKCLGGCYLRWGAFDPGASGSLARLPRTKETRKLESGRLVQSLHDWAQRYTVKRELFSS